MAKKAKRKNPSDLTLRNLHAMKKRIATLEHRVTALEYPKSIAPTPRPRSANSTGVGLEGGNR